MLKLILTTDFLQECSSKAFQSKTGCKPRKRASLRSIKIEKKHLEKEIQLFEETSQYMERQQSLFDAQLEVARLQAQKLRLELGQTVHIDLLPVVSTNN